jgi:hypothetical protein
MSSWKYIGDLVLMVARALQSDRIQADKLGDILSGLDLLEIAFGCRQQILEAYVPAAWLVTNYSKPPGLRAVVLGFGQ